MHLQLPSQFMTERNNSEAGSLDWSITQKKVFYVNGVNGCGLSPPWSKEKSLNTTMYFQVPSNCQLLKEDMLQVISE
jgi:hypothetical protein